MNAIFGILSMNEIPFYTELMIFRELHVFFRFQGGYDT